MVSGGHGVSAGSRLTASSGLLICDKNRIGLDSQEGSFPL